MAERERTQAVRLGQL